MTSFPTGKLPQVAAEPKRLNEIFGQA